MYNADTTTFSQYFRGSTEVLQRKYYSTFKEVLQSSLESTASRQAIVYQSRPTQPIKLTLHKNT